MGNPKQKKPKAELPRGFQDLSGRRLELRSKLLETIGAIYHRHGFEALETPIIERLESLGKHLPDVDRPQGGVFAWRDDDEDWVALRYDLTAPLARYVAENRQFLPRPFRRFQTGPVFRNEKPGPGRFRQFTQFDVDSVGTASIQADAELCLILARCLKAIGFADDEFVVRVNDRRLLDALLDLVGLEDEAQRGDAMRAMDKFDRLGEEGVRALLGPGRKDESGDETPGLGLDGVHIDRVLAFLLAGMGQDVDQLLSELGQLLDGHGVGLEALEDLKLLAGLAKADSEVGHLIRIDPSVVRGLGYYTGMVFEAELTFPVRNAKGEEVVFGSVAGGGRYDGLVARFGGEAMPATGMSIGIDRLVSAIMSRQDDEQDVFDGPVVVVNFGGREDGSAMALADMLRHAGVRAESYVGDAGLKAQMKYADRRRARFVVLEGEDERAQNMVTLKDLAAGSQLAQDISSRAEWLAGQPAQREVPRDKLAELLFDLQGRQK